MNENKKMVIVGIIIMMFIGLIGWAYYDGYKISKKELEKFYKAFNSETEQVIYIGKKTCYYCQLLKPILDDFNNQYKFGYTNIDAEKLNSNHLTEILNKLDIESEKFGTPCTIITKNKEKIAELAGAASEIEYYNFLKENNIIAKKEVNPINYINYEEYTKLINEKPSKTVIVLGNSSNNGYNNMMPILRKLKSEKKVSINYFSILEITQENFNEFADEILPTMLIINDKQEIVRLTYNKTYEEYLTFLEKNGIIE